MRSFALIGGGIVGTRVERLLREHGAGERDAVERAVNVRRVDSVEDCRSDDVVILAGGGRHAPTAARLGDIGASVVSVADALDDVAELRALDTVFVDRGATLVVGAAMAPGLSGLLVRHLHGSLAVCEEIHTAFHATAGPACAREHHRALAGWAVGWHDGEWIDRPGGSGRELCWFPEPVGAKDCYRAALAEPLLLHDDFPEALRISARVSATRRDRLTARLPMLRPPHPEGGVGAVRVELRGTDAAGQRRTLIAGIAEFVGAAAAATASAMALEAAGGYSALAHGAISTSHPSVDHGRVLDTLTRFGIRLQEFTGVAQLPR